MGNDNQINTGTGDDNIRLYGSYLSGSNAIEFGKGDGNDNIIATGRLDINIASNLSADDLNISFEEGSAVLSFEGSNDSLTISLNEYSQNLSAKVNFSDGRSFSLTPKVDVHA